MLCKQCGTENRDTASFCAGCGASLRRTVREENRPEGFEQEPQIGYCGQVIPPKKKIRPLWIAAAAVLLIVLIVVIACVVSGGDSCEEVAEKFVTAYLMNDQQTLEEVTESHLYEYLRSGAAMLQSPDACTAEVISSEKCTESEMDDLRELYSYLGAKGDFTNAHMVEVEYTVETDGTESGARVADVALSEIGGTWYVVYVG